MEAEPLARSVRGKGSQAQVVLATRAGLRPAARLIASSHTITRVRLRAPPIILTGPRCTTHTDCPSAQAPHAHLIMHLITSARRSPHRTHMISAHASPHTRPHSPPHHSPAHAHALALQPPTPRARGHANVGRRPSAASGTHGARDVAHAVHKGCGAECACQRAHPPSSTTLDDLRGTACAHALTPRRVAQ